MGNRANVYLPDPFDEGKGVYLYTHWGGAELPLIVQYALSRQQRWDDSPYLARIIFYEMIKEHPEHETGYGISATLYDNENPIISVNCKQQKVKFCEPGNEVGLDCFQEWLFIDYISVNDITLGNCYHDNPHL